MRMICNIRGQEYATVVQGMPLNDEFNETLDSASLIITTDHKIDLEPNEMVYLYDKSTKESNQVNLNESYFINVTNINTERKTTILQIENADMFYADTFGSFDIYSMAFTLPTGTYYLNKKKTTRDTLYFSLNTDEKEEIAFVYDYDLNVYVAKAPVEQEATSFVIKLYYFEPFYEKYLVVQNYQRNYIRREKTYKYTINLKSETSLLEGIQCPNLTITQKVNPFTHKFEDKQRSVADYIEMYLDLYSPQIKVIDKDYPNERRWKYVNKFTLRKSGKEWEALKNKICPEMSFSQDNLKMVINKLAQVCDLMPKMDKNVIHFIDISKPRTMFDDSSCNMETVSQDAGEFMGGARVSFQGAINNSQLTYHTKNVGFRDRDSGLLVSTQNFKIMFEHPIYKIKKFVVKYVKKIKVLKKGTTEPIEKWVTVEHDISRLVLLNSIRNNLNTEYDLIYPSDDDKGHRKGEPVLRITSFDQMSEYKYLTFGYEVGGSSVSGFSDVYERPYTDFIKGASNAKFTNIETVLNYLNYFFPFGSGNLDGVLEDGDIVVDYQNRTYVEDFKKGNIKNFSENQFTGLFFEISYYSMNNFDMNFYKKDTASEFIKRDNQSTSLVVLDNYSSNEQAKLERFGNEEIELTARVENFSQVQPVGSLYQIKDENGRVEDEYIIYHRTMGVNNYFINCNYRGVKKYLIKDYFTSISAKYRVSSVASYNESVLRNEIRNTFIKLDTDYEYEDTDFEAAKPDFYSIFLSGIVPHDFEKLDKERTTPYFLLEDLQEMLNKIDLFYINASYKKIGGNSSNSLNEQFYPKTPFALEYNSVGVQNYLGFNFLLNDNLSLGNFIADTGKPTMAIALNLIWDSVKGLYNNDVDVKGAMQDYYQYTDMYGEYGIPSSRQEGLELYMAKWKKPSGQDVVNYEAESYKKYIYSKPKLEKNEIGQKYFDFKDNKILKDNKEKLNYTIQFSYYTLNPNIFIGEYFTKLNDLVNKDSLMTKNNYKDNMLFTSVKEVGNIFNIKTNTYLDDWQVSSTFFSSKHNLHRVFQMQLSKTNIKEITSAPNKELLFEQPLKLSLYYLYYKEKSAGVLITKNIDLNVLSAVITSVTYVPDPDDLTNKEKGKLIFKYDDENGVFDKIVEEKIKELKNRYAITSIDEFKVTRENHFTGTKEFDLNSALNPQVIVKPSFRDFDSLGVFGVKYKAEDTGKEYYWIGKKYKLIDADNAKDVLLDFYVYNELWIKEKNENVAEARAFYAPSSLFSIKKEGSDFLFSAPDEVILNKNMYLFVGSRALDEYQVKNFGTYLQRTDNFDLNEAFKVISNEKNPYIEINMDYIKNLDDFKGKTSEINYVGVYYYDKGTYNLILGVNTNKNIKIFASFKKSKNNYVYESQEKQNIRGIVGENSGAIVKPLNHTEYDNIKVGYDIYGEDKNINNIYIAKENSGFITYVDENGEEKTEQLKSTFVYDEQSGIESEVLVEDILFIE